MEQILTNILTEYGAQLWLSAITIIVTTFVMTWLRNLIRDIFNYLKVKSASIGEQSVVIIDGKKYFVEQIRFRQVKLVNGDDIMLIPLDRWMSMSLTLPRYRDGIDIKHE
jgi:hypothetical protein